MFLRAIRNLNLFATLLVAYISLPTKIHEDIIFLEKIEECSKKYMKNSAVCFYATGYALEGVLFMT